MYIMREPSLLSPSTSHTNNITMNKVLCVYANTSPEKCYPTNSVRGFLTFLLVVVVVISLFGNLLLCGIVYRRSAMRSAINLLLANVALTDFLLVLLHVPVALAVLNSTGWPFNQPFCRFNGFIFQMLNCEKVLVLLVISIDRYFIIVKRCDTLTPHKSKILICSTWVISFIVAIPPVLGWGVFRFTEGSTQCLVHGSHGDIDMLAKSYILFSSVVTVMTPTLVLLFIYYRILRTVRRNGFRIQNHPPVTPTAMHKKGKYFIDYCYKTRMSTTILLLSLFYILSIFPLGVVNMIIALHQYGAVSMETVVGVLIFSYLHSASSPLLYYWRIKKYRKIVNDLCVQIFVFPHCVLFSAHRKRRVRPHVVYKVEEMNLKYINGLSK
eukprot:TCONS_00042868-protein